MNSDMKVYKFVSCLFIQMDGIYNSSNIFCDWAKTQNMSRDICPEAKLANEHIAKVSFLNALDNII